LKVALGTISRARKGVVRKTRFKILEN